jgi:hypothetical protein
VFARVQDVDRLGEHVGDEDLRHGPELNVAVDTARLPEIDGRTDVRRRAIRRDIDVEFRVERDGEDVVCRSE